LPTYTAIIAINKKVAQSIYTGNQRVRLYDPLTTTAIYDACLKVGVAVVSTLTG